MLLPGLNSLLQTASSVTSLLGKTTNVPSIFINVAVKQPGVPFLVLNRVAAPPAEATFDGISNLIEGEIQIDSYAGDQPTASKISNAVRDYLLKTFKSGALPDGTTISFVEVVLDHDEPYELGGTGYDYRALLRVKAFYTEAS